MPLDYDCMPIADLCQRWRTRRRWTQAEAAAVVGVTLKAWQSWEQGTRRTSGDGLLLRNALRWYDAAHAA